MKTFTLANGSVAKLGENSGENWELISGGEIRGDYYWFHLSAFPSGHLVLFSGEADLDALKECYSICKLHSKYGGHRNLKVDCTRIKNLKRTERRGEVEYKSNKKVKVLEFGDVFTHKTFDINPEPSPSKNRSRASGGRAPRNPGKIPT